METPARNAWSNEGYDKHSLHSKHQTNIDGWWTATSSVPFRIKAFSSPSFHCCSIVSRPFDFATSTSCHLRSCMIHTILFIVPLEIGNQQHHDWHVAYRAMWLIASSSAWATITLVAYSMSRWDEKYIMYVDLQADNTLQDHVDSTCNAPSRIIAKSKHLSEDERSRRRPRLFLDGNGLLGVAFSTFFGSGASAAAV